MIAPTPSDPEAAAIAAAIEAVWPREAEGVTVDQTARWRWSGRWWTKPVPLSRTRPW